MQSFRTQAHQRNYQGNVILPTANTVTKSQSQRHKVLTGIAIAIMALAVTVSSSLLGIMALHNQQLQQEIQDLMTQNTGTKAKEPCDHAAPCAVVNTAAYVRRGKTLERVPISEQTHETDELPLINHYQTHEN